MTAPMYPHLILAVPPLDGGDLPSHILGIRSAGWKLLKDAGASDEELTAFLFESLFARGDAELVAFCREWFTVRE